MKERLLLLAAALVAFGASLGSGFHLDDYAIFSDPLMQSPRDLIGMWGLRQTRPLTHLTFWINYQLGGNDPLLYHAVNLLLHSAAVLLLYECLRRVLPSAKNSFAPWLGAALFAVHPIQAEAVNYVWARSIVLASLLCFACLLAWMEGHAWEAVAWFAAALLAKEEVAAFPLVLWLVQRSRRRLVPLIAMLALSFAAGARVIYAASMTPGAQAAAAAGTSPAQYLLAQGMVILRYLRLFVAPYGLTIDPDIRIPAPWLGILAWVGVLALAALAWHYRKHPAAVWFFAGLLLLLPSSSIFPAADLAADRRMYLPMFGFATAAGLLLAQVNSRAVGIAVMCILTMASVFRTSAWLSERSLWTEAVERAPGKVRPKIQLARSLPAGKALELLNEAAKQAPYDPAVPAEIGKTLLSEGQPDAALTEFGRALALDPRDAQTYNNRGVALAQLGQTEAARMDFQKALEIDPTLAAAKENLSKLPGQ